MEEWCTNTPGDQVDKHSPYMLIMQMKGFGNLVRGVAHSQVVTTGFLVDL